MMITDDMVEAGAKAIWESDTEEPTWEEANESYAWHMEVSRYGDAHTKAVDACRCHSRACLEAVFPKPVRHDDGTVWIGDELVGIAEPMPTRIPPLGDI